MSRMLLDDEEEHQPLTKLPRVENTRVSPAAAATPHTVTTPDGATSSNSQPVLPKCGGDGFAKMSLLAFGTPVVKMVDGRGSTAGQPCSATASTCTTRPSAGTPTSLTPPAARTSTSSRFTGSAKMAKDAEFASASKQASSPSSARPSSLSEASSAASPSVSRPLAVSLDDEAGEDVQKQVSAIEVASSASTLFSQTVKSTPPAPAATPSSSPSASPATGKQQMKLSDFFSKMACPKKS